MLFKPQLVSCLLLFHGSKEVTWPSSKSMEEGIIQGHENREMYLIGGPYYNNIPYLASNTFSQAPVLPTSCLFYTTTAGQPLNTNYSVILELSVSQSVVILFPRRHLAISGDIFGCHNLKRGRC